MIYISNCPICNNTVFSKEFLCIDHTKSKENFNIVSCETCDFKFTNPRPSEKELPKYYNSDMYISHTNSSKGLFNWLYQKVRKIAIKSKIKLLLSLKKEGHHLDIGCGTGEFLNACKKRGFKTSGVEPSELARKQAIKNYNLNVSEKIELDQYSSIKFDSISMWHVLEHVTKINNTINQIERILKPSGKLIVAVPNNNSWDAQYYKENWAAWDVPIHLWHFSKKTIEILFKKHNLILTKTKPMIFDAYYVALLSEEFRSGKKNFIKGFIIGLISNIMGIFTKRGHSSTIFVFEKKK